MGGANGTRMEGKVRREVNLFQSDTEGFFLEVKRRGHMASVPAFFPPTVVLSSVTKWVGTGNQRVWSVGILLSFRFCPPPPQTFSSFVKFFFLLFLTLNFVKQATICSVFLFYVYVLDVTSFHSYRFCGEPGGYLMGSCGRGSPGCITVIVSCLFVFVFRSFDAGQGGGMPGEGDGNANAGGERERALPNSSSLSRNKKQPHRPNTTAAGLSLPTNPPATPPSPLLHLYFQQSHTLNPPLFLHAPASPRQHLAVLHCHACPIKQT